MLPVDPLRKAFKEVSVTIIEVQLSLLSGETLTAYSLGMLLRQLHETAERFNAATPETRGRSLSEFLVMASLIQSMCAQMRILGYGSVSSQISGMEFTTTDPFQKKGDWDPPAPAVRD